MYYHPAFGRKLRVRTKLNIYLPSDNDWYKFGSGEKYRGGSTVTVDAPLDEMPVFVKAGSVLPLNERDVESSKEKSPLEVLVYPGADGSFTYYDDDGETDRYKNCEFTIIEFEYNDKAGKLGISGNRPYTGSVRLTVKNVVTGCTRSVDFTGDDITLDLKG